MILVLKQGIAQDKIDALCETLESKYKIQTNPIHGSQQTVVGLVGDTSRVPEHDVENLEEVERVVKVQEPYKRANRKFHPEDTVVDVAGTKIGGRAVVVCGGPCAVESREQIVAVAESVKAAGATLLRGGAFKPRTSPYAFQGLKAEGLHYLKEARDATGLPVVSEITNPAQMELFEEYADMVQVGARNMQNFELLKEVGRSRLPVLLKRGFSNSIQELLMSAEYILSEGNPNVVLCERGIRTFETATRNTLDLSAVPVLKARTHLPVFVDPSHASGAVQWVEPLALAAVAVGADGLEIEVHNCPKKALSDGPQQLLPEQFSRLVAKARAVAEAV
ncbi:MAG: 3-deoxy-7-phosphoheptulonate synthase, partial [Kiritimatiellae bacterium]|nr:3-deoxy-7-phosphoheptulonate synthase [Kiritimatiellia bacterium]